MRVDAVEFQQLSDVAGCLAQAKRIQKGYVIQPRMCGHALFRLIWRLHPHHQLQWARCDCPSAACFAADGKVWDSEELCHVETFKMGHPNSSNLQMQHTCAANGSKQVGVLLMLSLNVSNASLRSAPSGWDCSFWWWTWGRTVGASFLSTVWNCFNFAVWDCFIFFDACTGLSIL